MGGTPASVCGDVVVLDPPVFVGNERQAVEYVHEGRHIIISSYNDKGVSHRQERRSSGKKSPKASSSISCVSRWASPTTSPTCPGLCDRFFHLCTPLGITSVQRYSGLGIFKREMGQRVKKKYNCNLCSETSDLGVVELFNCSTCSSF